VLRAEWLDLLVLAKGADQAHPRVVGLEQEQETAEQEDGPRFHLFIVGTPQRA